MCGLGSGLLESGISSLEESRFRAAGNDLRLV